MNENVFSPREQEILKVLGRKKMSITEIVDELNLDLFDANNVIAGAVRRINKKCETKKLSWFLNGEGSGRNGRTIWKEKRS